MKTSRSKVWIFEVGIFLRREIERVDPWRRGRETKREKKDSSFFPVWRDVLGSQSSSLCPIFIEWAFVETEQTFTCFAHKKKQTFTCWSLNISSTYLFCFFLQLLLVSDRKGLPPTMSDSVVLNMLVELVSDGFPEGRNCDVIRDFFKRR